MIRVGYEALFVTYMLDSNVHCSFLACWINIFNNLIAVVFISDFWRNICAQRDHDNDIRSLNGIHIGYWEICNVKIIC